MIVELCLGIGRPRLPLWVKSRQFERNEQDKHLIQLVSDHSVSDHWQFCTDPGLDSKSPLNKFGQGLWDYNLDRERVVPLIANAIVDRLTTKIATYGSLGVLTSGSIVEGVAAGLGAMVAIWVTRRWLDKFEKLWFRRLAILLMLISGLSMLWRSRGLLF